MTNQNGPTLLRLYCNLAFPRHLPRLLVSAALLLCLLAGGLPIVQSASSPLETAASIARSTAPYAGWAMDAYPGDSTAYLEAQMRRQLHAGANVVWLGHNNPGEVGGPTKHEPALSFAVWYAYQNPASPRHAQAVAMLQAQQHALDAARALGVRVVLPIGYQTQMGSAWNLAHPQAVRRRADGAPYNGPDPIDIGASFYAPDYQRDILAYYRWVDATLVRPYSSTILMLNLADEPKDGDYSTWADGVFRAAHGFGLHQAGADRARQEAVGRFESEYIANYAAWSARQWLAIDPAVPVTMSFDGGYGRYKHEGPDLEAIFRLTPANFVVTFDAYPRDGLYDTPLREGDLIALFSLVRTLGYYSALYHHPLWLWSAANSWGLNEASPDPGNIADAVANGIYLAQLARQGGGDLQGIAVWNYNIKGQGLYNDTHHLTYNPDQMFARVSASFSLLRAIMAAPAGTPATVLLAPDDAELRTAGAQLALRATDPYYWDILAAPARANVDAIYLTQMDDAPAATHAVLVLARAASDLTTADDVALRGLLARGGVVIAASAVAHALAGANVPGALVARGGRPAMTVRRLPTAHGALFSLDGGTVEGLFSDANAAWAAPLWRLALQRPVLTTGYVVAGGGVTLLYSIARGGTSISLALPVDHGPGALVLYDTHGAAVRSVALAGRHGTLRVSVARRSYALLPFPATLVGTG